MTFAVTEPSGFASKNEFVSLYIFANNNLWKHNAAATFAVLLHLFKVGGKAKTITITTHGSII